MEHLLNGNDGGDGLRSESIAGDDHPELVADEEDDGTALDDAKSQESRQSRLKRHYTISKGQSLGYSVERKPSRTGIETATEDQNVIVQLAN